MENARTTTRRRERRPDDDETDETTFFCFATQRAYVVYPPEGPRPPQSKRELDAYLANRRSEEKKRR
jgi:hypothetical protein